MDLPSCPGCNQSVLDDDATHCPFCGASMSGDGTSVPVAAPPIVAAEATEESTAQESTPEDTSQPEPAAPAPKPASSDSSDKDPFAVDPNLAHRAIPASAQPTRKRPWRVHCPMCDAPGFLPRQAAGREVKCANPECLVPIFTAPVASGEKPEPDEPTETEKPAAARTATWVGVLLVLAGGTAGTAWWFFADPSAPSRDPATAAAGTPGQLGGLDPPPTTSADPATKPAEETDSDTSPAATLSEAVSTSTIRVQAPPAMIAAAQQRERDGNRSKPFCRRLTAEYFAALGKTQAAKAQLQQLTQTGADLPHLHINALVELWWHRQPAGSAAADPQLVEAVQRSANLASSNPFAVDVAVSLGCALIASGQVPLAETTIARLWKPTLTARLRLDLLQCRQSRSFHLTNRNTSPPALRGEASVDSLIIERLCSRGHSDAALAWARRGPHQFDRADRLAAWAAASRNDLQAASATALDTALADQEPAIRAVVHARLALAAAAADKQAAAAQSIALATQALKQCAQPRTVALGNLKQTFQLPIDDVSDWWMKAQAQAELTGALCLLGQPDDARPVFLEALASARSLGPARADIAARLKAISTTGTNGMIQQFKTVLELTGNDEARQAAQQYAGKCRDWLVLAEQRAACLDRIHRFAIAHQLGHDAWKDIRDHGLTNDATLRDPFTTSTLPSFLYLSFQAAGDTTATLDMNRVLPTGLPVDATETLRLRAIALLANGNLDAVVGAVNADSNARRDRDSRFQRRRVLFELVGIAAASQSPAQALQLVGSFGGPRLAIWREDAYRLVAAQLATRGQHALAWKYATDTDRAPTEQVTLLAGLLDGIGRQDP